MCRRITCKNCGKPSWAGCGAHIEAVLGDIPEKDRCHCDRSAKKRGGASLKTIRRLVVFGRKLMVSALAFCGCQAPDVDLGSDVAGVFREVVRTPATLRNQVDLLFVVDNSEGMAARQAQLTELFRKMMSGLRYGYGIPDLHIGVVSTDLGVGRYGQAIEECSERGDGGTLRSPSLASCSASSDDFLAINLDGDGQLQANFEGDLTQAFACMTNLGEGGCAYQQPLEAMRTSLFNADEHGLGFVRPDSILGVIILSNNDDCSASNSDLFDPNNPRFRNNDARFRCFQSGVICDGDDVYEPGVRNGCRPKTRSDYIAPIGDYVDFLEEIKPNPADRMVTTIIGDSSKVRVKQDAQDMGSRIDAACQDKEGQFTYPGIRLEAFSEAFGASGETASLCQEEVQTALKDMAHKLRKTLGTTCLEGTIADINPYQDGRQVDCRVYEKLSESNETLTRFEACDNPADLENSSVTPCYTIQTGGEACGDFRTQLALQLHGRDTPPAADTVLVAECRVIE